MLLLLHDAQASLHDHERAQLGRRIPERPKHEEPDWLRELCKVARNCHLVSSEEPR